jgi:hypothetical protein
MRGAGSFHASVTLVDVVAAFIEGRGSFNDVAGAFYADNSTKRIVQYVCRIHNFEELNEDIFQEVGFRFSTQLVQRIREPRAAYAVIKATAKNVCGDLLRYHRLRPEISLDAIIEESEGSSPDSLHIAGLADERTSALQDVVAAALDHDRAITMFNQRLQQHGQRRFQQLEAVFEPPVELLTPRPAPPGSAENRASPGRDRARSWLDSQSRRTDTDADELIKMRDALGIDNARLAELLGLSEPMLNFYLYSERRGIPARVMAEARTILENVGKDRLETVEQLALLPMADVAERWMRMLTIDPAADDANVRLGAALGVNRATVWRWRKDAMRPKRAMLVSTHDKVVALVQQQRNAAEVK